MSVIPCGRGHRGLAGHRRRPGRRVPRPGLDGRHQLPFDRAVRGRGVVTVEGDISEATTTDRIIDAAVGRFGRIDTLVNNAGVFIAKPFTDYTEEDYATVVGVNLTGFFRLTQRAIAAMLQRGRATS